MPLITTPLRPTDTGPAVVELHNALLRIGVPIADAEKSAKRVGDSTLAAVLALRTRYGLPDVTRNAPPFDVSVARLLHLEVTALEGNRAALRTAVRESLPATVNAPPQVNSLQARIAAMAGLYLEAQESAARAPQLSGLVSQIIAAPLVQTPRPPEVPYPENFYTYYYKLVRQERLDELLGRTASAPPGSSVRMMRRRMIGRDGEGDWPDLPEQPEPEPPPSTQPDPARQDAIEESAQSWLQAVDNWQFGNEEFRNQRYASAVSAYTACQKAALNYFGKYYGTFEPSRGTLEQLVGRLVIDLASRETQWSSMWAPIYQRRLMLSLEELATHDWSAVTPAAISLLQVNLGRAEVENPESFKALRQRSLDRPLLILATIMAPLARAEANRLRRQYDAAERDLRRVLRPYEIRVGETPPTVRDVWLTCDFIELPFARLLLAETLLDKADAEYKARTPAAEPPAPDVTEFQSLKAAQTYLAVKDVFAAEEPAYVSNVETAATRLTDTIRQHIAAKDTTSQEFQLLGKAILVPTLESFSATLPGLDRRAKAHEPLLKFTLPEGQTMRETNPRVYVALLTATARLEQLKAGFNYLGYLDSYVPPWRFQFLLDRARYFAEHAKNAQREYLNFLSNAEREEFQELSAAQNVEMEKSNVRIEGAKVDQTRLEVAAAFQSVLLASIAASNSGLRLERYVDYDKRMDELESSSLLGSILGGLVGVGVAIGTGGAGAAFLAFGAWAYNSATAQNETTKAGEQRALKI